MQRLALPPGADPDLELWQLALDLEHPVAADAWLDLDPAEQARALALRQPADRVRLVASHSALRRLLARRLERPAAALRFRTGPHGKPQLAEPPDLPFNLAHSGAYALIALGGTGRLGVDIEQIRPAAMEAGVLERVLTVAERRWAGAEPAAFFRLWAAKEALLKAHGSGMSLSPTRISLVPDATGRLRLIEAPPEISEQRYALWDVDVAPDYAAALAWIEG